VLNWNTWKCLELSVRKSSSLSQLNIERRLYTIRIHPFRLLLHFHLLFVGRQDGVPSQDQWSLLCQLLLIIYNVAFVKTLKIFFGCYLRDSIIPTHDPSNPPRLVNFRTHFRFSDFFVLPLCRMWCMKHSRATSSVSAEHSRNYYHLWRPCCKVTCVRGIVLQILFVQHENTGRESEWHFVFFRQQFLHLLLIENGWQSLNF
jgi:hypothetical protein